MSRVTLMSAASRTKALSCGTSRLGGIEGLGGAGGWGGQTGPPGIRAAKWGQLTQMEMLMEASRSFVVVY